MFTKKPDSGSDPVRSMPPLPGARPGLPPQGNPAPRALTGTAAPSGAASVIGPDLTVNGNLQSKGEVHIEGQIQGDTNASRIVVGSTARITGGIVADDIVVKGTVMGSIRGNRVTLESSSKVEGDIFHQSLAIEQGAFFEGKSRRSENPLADAKSANGMGDTMSSLSSSTS